MSNINETKNDRAWSELFRKHRILEAIERKGFFEITASQINEFREARLMTKFDHSVNLPALFSKNGLAILPLTRGSYVISRFEAYHKFERPESGITKVSLPPHIESIDYENITSETTALNCAYASGILADFLEDDELLPTVGGRMGSNEFSFRIRDAVKGSSREVTVSNSQVEIDGGYEGVRQLAVIEAKNVISDDFLIRQLYYPFRLWHSKVSKTVTPVFLVYSNGVFHLFRYRFEDPGHYNSLVLAKQRNYTVEVTDITLEDIVETFQRTTIVDEPRIAFPQADKFERVVNLCELLLEEDLTRDEITSNYAFDPRQTNYYTDAGRYLGLIEKRRDGNEVIFSLTPEGKRIIRSKYKIRQLKLVESILRHKVFNEVFRAYLQRDKVPSREEIVTVMTASNLFQVGAESTFRRRASTVTGWLNWILRLQQQRLA